MKINALFALSLALLSACSDKGGDSATDSLFTLVAPGLAATDTSPDPDATMIYAVGADDRGGILWRVPIDGGAVEEVLVGSPLDAPQGLAVADGVVYIADGDEIVAVDTEAGGASTLSSGWSPMGLDLSAAGALFAVGLSESGSPVINQVAADGALTEVSAGALLESPSSVAVAADGALYVTMGADLSSGSILKVAADGTASVWASGLSLGSPAGLALTLDGSTLLVSGHSVTGGDQVYAFDTATAEYSAITEGISMNTEAGGVHRALRADVFSWADRTAGVYRVNP